MAEQNRQSIFDYLCGILQQMLEDWDYGDAFTDETYLVSDLGLESLDIVVLGENIQKHYNTVLPFTRFLADIGQREVRDISLGELVDFLHSHLNAPQ